MRSAVLTLVLVGALTTGTAWPADSSGVRGVLYRGPVTPVCREGVACDAPAVGVTVVFSRSGYVYRVRTGAGGRFSIALKPGVYGVRIAPAPTIGSGLAPRTVRVPVEGWARIRLTVDTGIR